MSSKDASQEFGGARGDQSSLNDAMWLAGQDIRRTWLAYPASALYIGLLGLFWGLSGAMDPGTYSFEFIMFAIGIILATPFFARDYMSWSTDPIAERLAWLRMLPIGVPTIVRARALALLVALPLNAIAFFTPVWFGGGWQMSGTTFLWFCLAITGVSLVGAGSTLALEMSVGIRRWIIINILTIMIVIVVMFVIGLGLDFRVFEQLARAVAWNGPLVALISVATGGLVMFVCIRLAEDGLRRRELVP